MDQGFENEKPATPHEPQATDEVNPQLLVQLVQQPVECVYLLRG